MASQTMDLFILNYTFAFGTNSIFNTIPMPSASRFLSQVL